MVGRTWNCKGGILMRTLILMFLVVLAAGCGSMEAYRAKNEPMPPRYYDDPYAGKKAPATPGSLWTGEGLFTDHRAQRVNDLITILVIEKTTGAKSATTGTEKKVTEDHGISSLFGIPLDLGIKRFLGLGQPFSPTLAADSASKLDAKGSTTRDGTLTASITAKVAEVLPNGHLVLEARKETLVNNENQILVLRGIVRSQDIRADNTVMSTYIADAKISFTGEGVIDDRQSPGWGTRVIDWVWPF